MCLGIPMQVVSVDGLIARCTAKGVEREVSLFLMQDELPAPGDYLVIQFGQATDRMTRDQAEAAWAIYDEILAAEAADHDHPA